MFFYCEYYKGSFQLQINVSDGKYFVDAILIEPSSYNDSLTDLDWYPGKNGFSQIQLSLQVSDTTPLTLAGIVAVAVSSGAVILTTLVVTVGILSVCLCTQRRNTNYNGEFSLIV